MNSCALRSMSSAPAATTRHRSPGSWPRQESARGSSTTHFASKAGLYLALVPDARVFVWCGHEQMSHVTVAGVSGPPHHRVASLYLVFLVLPVLAAVIVFVVSSSHGHSPACSAQLDAVPFPSAACVLVVCRLQIRQRAGSWGGKVQVQRLAVCRLVVGRVRVLVERPGRAACAGSRDRTVAGRPGCAPRRAQVGREVNAASGARRDDGGCLARLGCSGHS